MTPAARRVVGLRDMERLTVLEACYFLQERNGCLYDDALRRLTEAVDVGTLPAAIVRGANPSRRGDAVVSVVDFTRTTIKTADLREWLRTHVPAGAPENPEKGSADHDEERGHEPVPMSQSDPSLPVVLHGCGPSRTSLHRPASVICRVGGAVANPTPH
jgi:hypothetical protein